MWTYLTILFSLLLFFGLFARKAYLYSKKFKDEPTVLATGIDESEEEDEEKIVKKRLSKDKKQEVEEAYKEGDGFLKEGNDEEAIKAFVQALAIDDNHLDTNKKLALLYLQKQMFGAAAALFERLAMLEDDAQHYSHLGLALYQQSSFEEARDAYQKAVDMDPSRPQRFVSLSQVYKAMGQPSNAMVALNKALEMDKENLEFLYVMADLQMTMGNFEDAKETLNRIFNVNENHEEAAALLKEIEKLEAGTN
ncbi:MAG: DUF2225 domain-containing protein [Patescibacteria group bacterium]